LNSQVSGEGAREQTTDAARMQTLD